jgi:hypothetical protein
MMLTTRGCIPFDASCSTFAAISKRCVGPISETSNNGQTEGQINRLKIGLDPYVILVANSGAEPDQATICRAANCEIRVFAEGMLLCHSATLTRLTATAVMTCCKRVFANPI